MVTETFVFRNSSNLLDATYDPDVENLTITFSDGSQYEYYNVPASVYRALTQASSAGQYWNRQKGSYSYEKL
jgi:hypothetical protein